MDEQTTNEREPIALWQRIVFGAVIPLVATKLLASWYLRATLLQQSRKSTPGWGLTVFDILGPLVVFGVFSIVFMPLIVVVVVRFSCLPWRHWWSALLGGLLAIAVGVALGMVVLALLKALS